jgi:hypothetical protein
MSGLKSPTSMRLPGFQAGTQLIASKRFPIHEALIDRLLLDGRMKDVWKSLCNPKKCAPFPAALDRWRKESVLEGLSDQDVALAVFFFYACSYAHFKFRTVTTASFVKRREPFLMSARILQEEARLLRERWFAEPEAEVHAAAIEAASSFHMSKTKNIFQSHPRLIERDQGDPQLRAYALYMAIQAKSLFGRIMYGTIATVTNVAMVENNSNLVSAANVRDWWRSSIRANDRLSKDEF